MPKTTIEIKDRAVIRRFEVHGEIGTATLRVCWERWDGAGTADVESVPDGKPHRPDFELSLSFRQLSSTAQWYTGHNGSAGLLSGTDLDPQIIRAYATLLDQLADQVETAGEADAAYYREHDRLMQRRLKRA